MIGKITKKPTVKKSGWIKANFPLGPIYNFSSDNIKEKKTIYSLGLLKPGMMLELENGKILLVGHINKNGGVCDDCPYDKETMVKRYKKLNIKNLI